MASNRGFCAPVAATTHATTVVVNVVCIRITVRFER
jgi:hypothetical protein